MIRPVLDAAGEITSAQWWGHCVRVQTESYLLATEQDFDATIDDTAIDDSDFDHDDDFDLSTDD